MDLTKYRDKLVGSKEDRAVSPVIGVILMVAITVILAAVIAAFVLDMGSGLDQDAQAGVQIEEVSDTEVQVTADSLANADGVVALTEDGTPIDDDIDGVDTDPYLTESATSMTFETDGSGSDTVDVNVVAYFGEYDDRSGASIVGSFEIDEGS
ncbi:type IV pilin [Natronococcus pandeyae]|uniref:Type IV pilin n=1 Tax=Natronococcus pandeyae TaxID=2055836 RepID=A0A8J8TPB2_9EURY|nr:type IV pilin N-terminal domain-containing protein [Natronococcus pandeyae]TYL37238.1 type IV pilin [Natronococcus pandeyae]